MLKNEAGEPRAGGRFAAFEFGLVGASDDLG